MNVFRSSRCPRCRRPIIWGWTGRRHQALDVEPTMAGEVAGYQDHTGTFKIRSVRDGVPLGPLEKVYMPHGKTCRRRSQVTVVIPIGRPERTVAQVISLADRRKRDE